MAKRIVPLEKFGVAKKLKLDISINRSRNSETTNIVEFWTSDDDDDVLLATQKAEENQLESDAPPNTQNKFTFKKFAAEALRATTSTQELFNDEMLRSHLPTNLTIEEIFGTDETNVFLPDTDCGKKTDLEVADINKAAPASTNWATETRRQLAQERQLKFLMERVDLLKKENTKLQRDLADSNNQASTKEGEVSMYNIDGDLLLHIIHSKRLVYYVTSSDKRASCSKLARSID